MTDALVIGSGPTGAACAAALAARGKSVTIVDGGHILDAEPSARVRALAEKSPLEWRREDWSFATSAMRATSAGVPLKLLFGSDFPYRDAEATLGLDSSGIDLKASLAVGGFSNVWGAAMLPYSGVDLAAWPITQEELKPHYEAVTAITGLSGREDDLATEFPLYCRDLTALEPSRQAQKLLIRLAAHRERLKAAGVIFGQSRVAIRGRSSGGEEGCVYCGHCMYGCPYGFIYNSADTLRGLIAQGSVQHRPGLIVHRITEKDGVASVYARPREGGPEVVLPAANVFLAAGVIATTGIMLRSLDHFDVERQILDSQYFLFPIVFPQNTRAVEAEELHTLSQVFIEVLDPEVSRHRIHLQVYSYNGLIEQALQSALGPLSFLSRSIRGRMLIVQGYLHSDDSSQIAVTASSSGNRLKLRPHLNPETPKVVRRLLKKLSGLALSIGGLPLSPMLQLTGPGRGFHSGGSFPMSAHPGAFETDLLGRPQGFRRLHVVDSSVFPTVPATTITYSAMANAHRIGATATLED